MSVKSTNFEPRVSSRRPPLPSGERKYSPLEKAMIIAFQDSINQQAFLEEAFNVPRYTVDTVPREARYTISKRVIRPAPIQTSFTPASQAQQQPVKIRPAFAVQPSPELIAKYAKQVAEFSKNAVYR